MSEDYSVLKPVQPYFVFDTQNFRQEVCLRDGISHFYSFTTESEKAQRLVPDGCIDIFFEYDPSRPGHMHSYVAGTKLSYTVDSRLFHNEIFGVRFMPGNRPAMLDVTMKDLLGKRIESEYALRGDISWLGLMARETDFYGRMRIFSEHYGRAQEGREKPSGKLELLDAVKKLIYGSCGKIKIHDLEEKTNYTERYINKIFIEEMGFPPKIFCKIIQFQKSLELLNYGKKENMTQVAVELGYYDQSQFIRDFTKYCGITPNKYLKLVEGLGCRSDPS